MNTNVPPEQQVPFLIGAIIGALVVGTLCGLLPFFLARSRGRQGLGIAALVTCIIGGFFAGLIAAVPLMIIFTVIVMAMGHAPGSQQPGFPMESQQSPYGGVPRQYPPPGMQTPPPQQQQGQQRL